MEDVHIEGRENSNTVTLYVNAKPGVDHMFALDEATGAFIWSRLPGCGVIQPSGAVADGILFYGTHDQNVYAIGRTATQVCNAFLTPKKLNLKRSAEHSFKIHIYPCEAMDVSVGDLAQVYVDVDGNEVFDDNEQYEAIVSSTDRDGAATDIAIKVYCDHLVDNDPGVAIYSINSIDIVYADELGGGLIDDLALDTFLPPRKGHGN